MHVSHRSFVIFLFIILPMAGGGALAATLLVDNNPANDAADYHNLQEGIDAASAGDTIYVMGSMSSYSATIEKSVTLVGSGALKSEIFGIASSDADSRVSQIYIRPGTSDVFLTGFVIDEFIRFVGDNTLNAEERTIENIYIFRNYFRDSESSSYGLDMASADTQSAQAGFATKVFLINNVFDNGINLGNAFGSTLFEFENVVIEGNIFRNGARLELGDRYFQYPTTETFASVSAVVRNNHFEESYVILDQGAFYNNVLVSGTVELRDDSPGLVSAVESNCFVQAEFPTEVTSDEGNFLVSSGAEVFLLTDELDIRNGLAPIPDGPLIGAGVGGSDIGVFGGQYSWPGHIQPPLPFISKITGPIIVNPEEGMTLTIEAGTSN